MNITEKQMLDYLQAKLTKFEKMAARYGMDDKEVCRMFDDMIACKEMVEALIGQPVNLQQDGLVTVGF